MRLTKEKLLAAWRIRKQIFGDPANEQMIKRYEEVSALFKEIDRCALSFDENDGCYKLDGSPIVLKNGDKPSYDCYFSCKEDEMTANQAFEGLNIMCDRFPDEFSRWIVRIGCLLGGFSFDGNHAMKEEYRIISNTVTGWNDNGSLTSYGQIRHPSSHLADNNYFFQVIRTIKEIKEGRFDCDATKLVLRWPNATYYTDDRQAEAAQKETLRYRFPYKFFYMWTHDVLHPFSLLAYRNLAQQEDESLRYAPDREMNQDFGSFVRPDGWERYSSGVMSLIPAEERGDEFWHEMSKLISILMIKDQPMKNMQELLETGNKAIILYGPPGTGKTHHAMELVCGELGIEHTLEETQKYEFDTKKPIIEKGAWTLVQFHPNYTYEDFIGGIIPKLTGDTLAYALKTGLFKQLCDTAVKPENRTKKFIIIIDEINRADLSSVFGELMYALEYRDRPVAIPHFEEKFVIPSNVYVIGTMNSIDKSLVTFDLALRRRFGFVKIMPQLSALESMLADYHVEEDCLHAFIARCRELNERIANPNSRLQLGSDYQIGHAYYGKIKDFLRQSPKSDVPQVISTFDLEKLWEYHLEPLLEEYLGNRVEDAEAMRCLNECKNNFTRPL